MFYYGSVTIIGPLHLYQVLTIILAIFALALMYLRVRSKKSTVPTFILWIIVWVFIVIFAFNPRITDPIAGLFGMGRGLDLLVLLGLFACFYLIFKLYFKIDELDQNITDLVRELAIANEIIADYQKKDNDKTDDDAKDKDE